MDSAMSSNHKQRSFMKSKRLSNSFSKVVTKSFMSASDTTSNHHGRSQMKPLSPPVWMDSSSSKHSNYAFTPPVQSASTTTINTGTKQGNPISAKTVSYGISADEDVDKKAACYISKVRERFKLETLVWDQTNNKHHEDH